MPPEPIEPRLTTIQWVTSQLRFDRLPGAPTDALPSYLSWEEVISAAQSEGLAGFLLSRLDARTQAEMPVMAFGSLEYSHIAMLVQNSVYFQELERLLAYLAANEIPVIVLKGAALTMVLYGRRDIRPMVDLDLLVPEADFARVIELLQTFGYAPSTDIFKRIGSEIQLNRVINDGATIDRALLESSGFVSLEATMDGEDTSFQPETVAVGETSIAIDLHWHLVSSTFYTRHVPMDWFWEHTALVEIGQQHARVFSPEAQLLHLCSHHALHHADQGLFWLYDIAELIRQYGSILDWDTVITLANRYEWGRSLASAVEGVFTVFGMPVDPAVKLKVSRLQESPQERFTRAMVGRFSWVLVNGWQHVGLRRRLGFWLRMLFPPADYMRRRYGASGRIRLGTQYLRRAIDGVHALGSDLWLGAAILIRRERT